MRDYTTIPVSDSEALDSINQHAKVARDKSRMYDRSHQMARFWSERKKALYAIKDLLLEDIEHKAIEIETHRINNWIHDNLVFRDSAGKIVSYHRPVEKVDEESETEEENTDQRDSVDDDDRVETDNDIDEDISGVVPDGGMIPATDDVISLESAIQHIYRRHGYNANDQLDSYTVADGEITTVWSCLPCPHDFDDAHKY